MARVSPYHIEGGAQNLAHHVIDIRILKEGFAEMTDGFQR